MKPLHAFVHLCLVLNLTACGGGYEGSPSPTDSSSQLLALAGPSSLTLVPSELSRVVVTGGTRPYTAISQNNSVVLASVSDGTLSVAAVGGDAMPVTVTVTDARNAKASLTVNVTNAPVLGSFSLSTQALALSPGDTRALTITGGTPPFSALASKPSVATGTVSGNVVTVAGISEGLNAELRVIDSRGATQSALVTVAAPTPSASGVVLFSNIPATLTLRPNTSQTFTLGGGTGPYTAVSSNPASLNTTTRGNALVLEARSGGRSTLSLADSSGQVLTRSVRVLNTSAPLALTSAAVTGMVGTSTTVGIAGGLPPYRTVSTSTTQVGTASILNGDTLQINFGFVGGPMRVTVLDAEGSTAVLDIVGTAVLSAMSVSPSRIVISELLSRDLSGVARQTRIPLLFVNSRAPIQVFSSHPRLLTPVAIGSVVTVTTPGTADEPVAPCVDLNTEVFITGIDASGATSSTAIFITDNGACPN